MKPFRYHPEAEAEMIDAAAWYEAQQPDPGKRFPASVHDAVNRIELNPELYPIVERDGRHASSPRSGLREDTNTQTVMIPP